MSRERIAYVILHYNTIEDTKKCVSSIRNMSDNLIVIVCNGSRNGSDTEVEKTYYDQPNVHVIVNKNNKGFAAGNNTAIRYIREKDLADLIVCVNNDVIFCDDRFEYVVKEEYVRSHFGVGGVDVRNPYGEHCSPRYEAFPTRDNIEKTIKKFEKAVKRCTNFYGIGEILYSALRRVFKPANHIDERTKIMTLHGCCLIFSPVYFSYFSGMCEDTFLYGEEIILSYLCYKAGITVKYIDKTFILHNESKATKEEFKKVVSRHRFYYENILDSTKVLRRIAIGTDEFLENLENG